jgi:IclR family KDG regulon transcriptional repressor
MELAMIGESKRVPAIDKCFAILELFARSTTPLGVSEISRRLQLNKSTVFHIIHTLANLHVLEKGNDGKFRFGYRLFSLGIAAGEGSSLIQTVHPQLVAINKDTTLSAFLGIRSAMAAVIIDKVDTAYDIKISSEIGMRIPLLAGAGGKALLAQLTDEEIDRILKNNRLKKYTANTCVDKARYKREVLQVRDSGLAVDREEYIEGIVAFAIPLFTQRDRLQAAVWAVGLKNQLTGKQFSVAARYMKRVGEQINQRFSLNGIADAVVCA